MRSCGYEFTEPDRPWVDQAVDQARRAPQDDLIGLRPRLQTARLVARGFRRLNLKPAAEWL